MIVRSGQRWLWIVLFLAPALVLFFLYFVYPLGFVFVTSTLEWNGISKPEFVGLRNYIDNFGNRTFQFSIRNNFIWLGSLAIVQIALAAIVAMILARQPRGWRFFRTVYFLPNVISQVAIAMMWAALYNAEYGAINQFLELLGLEHLTHNWLGEIGTALPAILVQQVFYIGYFMIIKNSPFLRYFVQSLVYSKRRSIRAMRGHGFNDVSYCHNSCLKKNVIS